MYCTGNSWHKSKRFTYYILPTDSNNHICKYFNLLILLNDNINDFVFLASRQISLPEDDED